MVARTISTLIVDFVSGAPGRQRGSRRRAGVGPIFTGMLPDLLGSSDHLVISRITSAHESQ